MQVTAKELFGWGNLCHGMCHAVSPISEAELCEALAMDSQPSWLARGLGRSYGDAAINSGSGVILPDRLEGICHFDALSKLLTARGGTSLAAVIERVLPQGYYLPVTPGTCQVSIGGAIAADVHGKNHHCDGSFINFVRAFTLLTASGDRLGCSREQNADVFWATAGGMGLTGVIVDAQLELTPVETAYVCAEMTRVGDLDKMLDCLESRDRRQRYSIAWVDCHARGKHTGRGVLITGHGARVSDLPPHLQADPLRLPNRRRFSVPRGVVPKRLLNRHSIRLLNSLYYHRGASRQTVMSFDKFFHPLDFADHWNRLYGRWGFAQFQAVLPEESSRRGLLAILECVSRSRLASFVAGIKTAGAASDGLLSFMRPGHTIAIDLLNRPCLTDTLEQLNQITTDLGGRVYLAKDSSLRPEQFAVMYPRLEEFRRIKRRLDPANRFASSLSRRLAIVEAS